MDHSYKAVSTRRKSTARSMVDHRGESMLSRRSVDIDESIDARSTTCVHSLRSQEMLFEAKNRKVEIFGPEITLRYGA